MTTHVITFERTEPRKFKSDGNPSRRWLFKREDGSVIGIFGLTDYCAAALLNGGEVQPDDELDFRFHGITFERDTALNCAALARRPH
jgi:hypothetical protein